MSAKKLNYFEVTETSIVKARNKTEALAIANGRKNVPGEVLSDRDEITRLPAAEARALADNS